MIRGEKNIVKKVAVKINVVLVKVKIGIVPPLELKEGIDKIRLNSIEQARYK